MAGETLDRAAVATPDRATHAAAAPLLQETLKDCKRNQTTMRCISSTTGLPQDFELVDGAASSGGKLAATGTGEVNANTAASELAHAGTSGVVASDQTLQRSATELAQVKAVLANSSTGSDDRLRAAAVLAANGESHLKADNGTEYTFAVTKDGTVTLNAQELSAKGVTEQTAQETAKIGTDGNLVKPANTTDKSTTNTSATDNNAQTTSPDSSTHPEIPPPKGAAALLDPSLSVEDKLRAAQEMAHNKQRRFKGPDGKTYEIATRKYGDREAVTVFESDDKGHARPILRGIIDKNHNVTEQKNNKGQGAGLESDYAKKHEKESEVSRHDEARQNQDHKQDKPDKPDKPQEATDGRDKISGSPEDLKRLDEARARLRGDAEQNIYSVADRQKFETDMQTFENRAKTQPLSAKEVADTYDQLSRLLEANDGKVPKENRVLAAESFAHHMADPTNIDQGQHETCNVTSEEEHLMTRNPSKLAEIVATTALTGQWVAPDGKVIKLDQDSLVPGREERNFPPKDSERSFATQLMNQVLVNDAEQRKMPPMFYSQGRPQGQGDTGERLRYADGTDVKNDDIKHNGDTKPYNAPAVWCSDITQSVNRLTGDNQFLIVGNGVDRSSDLVHVGSAQELGAQLSAMKTNGKLPAIIMVDVNDPMFHGSGDPTKEQNWHVISVVGFDEATGKVKLSNQWGSANDITVDIADLYRTVALRTPTAAKPND